MRILVIGAGNVGSKVLLQLKKNPSINIITVDPRENPPAVMDGVIESVDYHHELKSGDLSEVIMMEKPDLVLVTTSPEDMARAGIPGLDLLVEALREELESSTNVPIIAVSRAN